VIVSGLPGVKVVEETTGGGNVGVALLMYWVRGTEVAGLLFVSPL
jgi:hypothetical protein